MSFFIDSCCHVGGRVQAWLLALPVLLAAMIATPALAQPSGNPQVYRGWIQGPTVQVWMELHHEADGAFVLYVLDGLPGITWEPTSYSLVSSQRGRGRNITCELRGEGVSITGACPASASFRPRVDISGAIPGIRAAQVDLVPVGANGSLAFIQGDGRTTPEGAPPPPPLNCSITQTVLQRYTAFPQSVAAIGALNTQLAAVPADSRDASQLPLLRRTRHEALRVASLTPAEEAELQRYANAASALLLQGELLQAGSVQGERNRLEQQMRAQPHRVRAAEAVRATGRQMSAIYDPVRSARRVEAVTRIATALTQVDQTVATEGRALGLDPAGLDANMALEIATLPEILTCARAFGLDARSYGQTQAMVDERFSALQPVILQELSTGNTARPSERVLLMRNSEGVREVLTAAGLEARLNPPRAAPAPAIRTPPAAPRRRPR